MPKRFPAAACLILASPAFADVATSVDLLDASDGGTQPPAGVIAIDILVDVTPDDHWTAGGLRGLVTAAGQNLGVSIRYVGADDPNSFHDDRLFNPGAADRFGTFFTRPRARDSDERYTNAGAVVAGRYVPLTALEVSSPLEINIAWFASPNDNDPNAPSVDGATARVSLNVAGVEALPNFAGFAVGNAGEATGPIIFQSSVGVDHGTVSASFRHPDISGLNWGIWYTIPEPASLVLLAAGGLSAVRRRV